MAYSINFCTSLELFFLFTVHYQGQYYCVFCIVLVRLSPLLSHLHLLNTHHHQRSFILWFNRLLFRVGVTGWFRARQLTHVPYLCPCSVLAVLGVGQVLFSSREKFVSLRPVIRLIDWSGV